MDLYNQKYISLEHFLQGLEEKVATQNNNNKTVQLLTVTENQNGHLGHHFRKTKQI